MDLTAAGRLKLEIEARYRARLQTLKGVRVEFSNRASELGHPCERYLVLLRREGHKRRLPSDETQGIFEEGKRVELQMRALLAELGYDLQGAQADFPENLHQITGHVDGKLYESESGTWVLVEIKGVNGSDFDRIRKYGIAHIKENPRAWLAKWYTQIQLYLYLGDMKEALWVLKDKWRGGLECLPVPLDLGFVEPLLDKADRINAYMTSRELPGYYSNPWVCEDCSFFGVVCTPALNYGDGAEMVDDPAVVKDFERLERLQEIYGTHAAELWRLQKRCKGYLQRRAKGDLVLVGNTVAHITRHEAGGYFVAPSERVTVKLQMPGRSADGRELEREEPEGPE